MEACKLQAPVIEACRTVPMADRDHEVNAMFETEPNFELGFTDLEDIMAAWRRMGPMTVERASEHTNRTSTVLNDHVQMIGQSVQVDLTKIEGTIKRQLQKKTRALHSSDSDEKEVDPFLKYDGYMRKLENCKCEQRMYEGQCKRGAKSGFGRQISNKEIFVGHF